MENEDILCQQKENEMWYQGKKDIYIDELMLIASYTFVPVHVQLCTHHTHARDRAWARIHTIRSVICEILSANKRNHRFSMQSNGMCSSRSVSTQFNFSYYSFSSPFPFRICLSWIYCIRIFQQKVCTKMSTAHFTHSNFIFFNILYIYYLLSLTNDLLIDA